jgi:hypothetical protein
MTRRQLRFKLRHPLMTLVAFAALGDWSDRAERWLLAHGYDDLVHGDEVHGS